MQWHAVGCALLLISVESAANLKLCISISKVDKPTTLLLHCERLVMNNASVPTVATVATHARWCLSVLFTVGLPLKSISSMRESRRGSVRQTPADCHVGRRTRYSKPELPRRDAQTLFEGCNRVSYENIIKPTRTAEGNLRQVLAKTDVSLTLSVTP